MSIVRLRGTIHHALLRRLPRNLVVFDGHCLLCQERVRHVLERNFSFFAFRTLFTQGMDSRASEAQLHQHEMYFASFDSDTGEELLRVVFKRGHRDIQRRTRAATPNESYGLTACHARPDVKSLGSGHNHTHVNNRVTDRSLTALLSLPDDLMFLFFEKVPSESSARGCARYSSVWCANEKGSPAAVCAAELSDSQDVDILVSTNYVARCRMGMHLDRWLLRWFWWACYRLVPRWLGCGVFDRCLSRRRAVIWGTSEEDAVAVPQRILGMKERRWSTRCGGRPRQMN